jgi:hypothetical protein
MRGEAPIPPATKRQVLSAAAEGNLRSAFGPARATRPARVLLIASGLFLSNPLAFTGNPHGDEHGDEVLLAMADRYARKHVTNTILSFKNTLDWMSAEEDMIELAPNSPMQARTTDQAIGHPKQFVGRR